MTVLVIGYAAIILVWAVRLVVVALVARRLLVLSPASLAQPGQESELPFVSILVPARNEEENIRECLDSLLAQDYPRFEVIVIDDRSTDGTASIVRERAKGDSRLRLKSVAWLPPGWTGKTYALEQGVRHAKGDWLLFVDADTRHHPLNLRTCVGHALEQRIDLLSLLPKLAGRSFWERVVQPLAGVVLMIFFRLWKVNSDACPTAFANGQYILVRRGAYEAVGGHAAVRRHFVEDIQLGRLIKQAGYRLRVALAPQLTHVRMYASLGEIIRGWSRILYGAVGQRPMPLLMVMLAISLFSLTAFAGSGLAVGLLLAGNVEKETFALLGLNLLHHILIIVVMGKLYSLSHSRRRQLAFYLPACVVVLSILARSVQLCFTHRVTWRETEYGPDLRQAA